MSYAYPAVPEMGMRLKAALSTYQDAGGRDACILFHDAREGRAQVLDLGRRGKGLPARVIPIECFHIASIGIDLMLGALAYGASQVLVLSTEKVAEGYAAALQRQMGHGQAILHGLGYGGTHFRLVTDLNDAWTIKPASTVAKAASFNLSQDKRTTLDFALEHLAKDRKVQEIKLAAGAPFGTLAINKTACTLCKACIGACPESALLDSPETPSLRFIERNCVQCGLCANTCPEDAIRLVPRLLLGPQAKEPVTLNEAQPFNCVRCGKPFGTRQMVENMLGKLTGHSMFAGSTRRLQMCGDCRVVDMMENTSEQSVFDYTKR
jgi:ferredoxin